MRYNNRRRFGRSYKSREEAAFQRGVRAGARRANKRGYARRAYRPAVRRW